MQSINQIHRFPIVTCFEVHSNNFQENTNQTRVKMAKGVKNKNIFWYKFLNPFFFDVEAQKGCAMNEVHVEGMKMYHHHNTSCKPVCRSANPKILMSDSRPVCRHDLHLNPSWARTWRRGIIITVGDCLGCEERTSRTWKQPQKSEATHQVTKFWAVSRFANIQYLTKRGKCGKFSEMTKSLMMMIWNKLKINTIPRLLASHEGVSSWLILWLIVINKKGWLVF